jgi:DNA-binding SARP family transcriptional activator/tetratricopeptide (TPR) repeat protein
LLGRFELAVDGTPLTPPATVKARSLLAYLAGRSGAHVRRETVMSEFWPDADPTSARNNLKTALSSIRKAFRDAGVEPDRVVEVGREVVRWVASSGVDAGEFERCSADVAGERERALALYRGELLPGDYAPWAAELRDRLAARFEDMLRAELAQHPSASLANRVLLLDPYCSDAYQVVIEDALRGGNRREAQLVYHRYAAALAEVGSAPSTELAVRVGARERAAPIAAPGFVGRASELAEIGAWFADPAAPNALLVVGLAGIGKSALLEEARRAVPGLAESLVTGERVVAATRPDGLAAAREAYPEARELELGPLSPDEVARALARCFASEDARRLGDAVWPRAQGHPLLLDAEIQRLAGTSAGAPALAPHFPRAVERRFEEQLQVAGSDACRVAELLAFEPQLDDDDLVALLEWSIERVGEARERLIEFGILERAPCRFAFTLFGEIAARRLTSVRRQQTIARITERLALHEHPSAKVRIAEHLVALGREREAAQAFADAGRDYAGFAAWGSAIDAFDAGVALLDPLATSVQATGLLRELYVARGNAQYQAGQFSAALRSLESALDLSAGVTGETTRARLLVTMGNALWRIGHVEAASAVARHATDEATRDHDLGSELEAVNLRALVFSDGHSEAAFAVASEAYARATAAGEWTAASMLAQRAADATRRMLRFVDCHYWVKQQRQAAVLAGPILEAQAHYAVGSFYYAVQRLDSALECCHDALRLIAGVRRRRTLGPFPLGQLEWSVHQALAHTYAAAGDLNSALTECEWLMHSPWAFNTPCVAMTLATVVDVRLATGRSDDRHAALAFAARFPTLPDEDRAAFLDRLTRARLAAFSQPAEVAQALAHEAFALIEGAELRVPDQVHLSYEKLAAAVRDVDVALADRAAEAGRRHRRRVIEAAGPLWAGAALELVSRV